MSKAASLAGFATAITPPSDLVVGIVTASYVSVASSVSATTFYGSGENLTGIAVTANIRADRLVVAGVTTVSAGSTAAPAIVTNGDPNTGIYFPAADSIAVSSGGAERLRIDSSGNISADSNTFYVDATNNRVAIGTATPNCHLDVRDNVGGSARVDIHSQGSGGVLSTLTAERNGGLRIATESSAGWLAFNTGSSGTTERLRIDSSGRFLVGKTSNNITNEYALFGRGFGPNSNSTAFADQQTPLSVYGDFGSGSNDQICSSALTVYGWSSLAGNSGSIMRGWWSTNGPSLGTPTLRFQVASSGNVTNSNNSYGSLSDIRYKQDITLAGSQWEDIKNISVKKFRFIDDVKNETEEKPAPYFLGCIAQEVAEVSPGLVEVRGDDKDENGNVIPEVLTLKYSVLYMKAIKALQEAQERIETLEAQNATQASAIEALTARLDAAGL